MQDARRASPEGSASLHAEILTRLRDFIVEGHLPPGARVPERQLCETLAVSRTPLREALKVLAAEGLIELLPNRGARVREFAEKDIREVFEIVAGLEFVAGRLACEAISDEEIAAIERMHYDMYTHYMRRELGEYFQLNQKIHEAIVEASQNLILRSAYASYNALIGRIRYAANLHRNRWSEAMREHEAMVDALRRRAGEELGLLMFEHMRNKCEAACEHFRATRTSGAASVGD
jgi:DNA-binding GntR family transcriptional regulator